MHFFRRILKWVLWVSGLLLVILVLLAAGVFFMPKMVSTEWFRHQLETQASGFLHQAVTVQELHWTWKNGIRIKGLEAADDPKYGKAPLLFVDDLLLYVDFELKPRRLLIQLEADGLKANLVRKKDGHTNLEAWLAQLKPSPAPSEAARSETKAKAPVFPLVLPGDLAAQINLTHVQVRVEDRMENRSLAIREGALTLKMPSLRSSPIDLKFNSKPSMDGKAMPPIALAVHVNHLTNEGGALDPQGADVRVNGVLPGLHMALDGTMAQKGLKGEVKIDLASLLDSAQPFMPETLPEVSGEILLQTNAKLKTDKMIAFHMNLICKSVLAKGGPLKKKQVGPFSLTLAQKGSAELSGKTVNVEHGEIHLMEKSGLSYGGRFRMEEQSRLNVELALDRVSFDLNEIKHLAKDFIPKGISWKGLRGVQGPDFKIHKVQLSGTLPDGSTNLSIQDMILNLPECHLQRLKDPVKAEKLTLVIPRAVVRLKKRFPEALEMRLSLNAEHVQIAGKQPLSLDQSQISSLSVAIQDLAPSEEALWGMAGRITFEESGFFKGIRLAPQNDGTDHLSHRFKAGIDLPSAPEARINFAEADLSAAPLKLKSLLPHPLKEGVTLKGRLKDGRITQLKPFNLSVAHFEADLQSGDGLKLEMQGAAFDSGRTSFRCEGLMDVDLATVSGLAPPGFIPEGRFSGRMETRWQLQGRRPTHIEMAAITDKVLSLEKRLQHVDFLKELDIKTRFMDLAMTMPLDSGETVSVHGIHSVKPFSIHTADGFKSVSVAGGIKMAQILDLPSMGKLKTPLGADLSFDALSRNLNSLELRENLQLTPLAVEQSLELSLNKLNQLLRKKRKPNLTTLLKILEARIKAGIAINAGPHLAPFAKGATLEGPLNGHLDVALRGGKSVSIEANLESEGIDVALPSKLAISNLKTHLQLEKSYALLFGSLKTKAEKPVTALSLSVLQPEPSPPSKSFATNPLSQRLMEDLRGRLSKTPTLSFAEARLEKGPFPILLKNAQLQMRFSQSLPSLDYFQVDVMGGTLLGALRVLENRNRYRLQLEGAFSGLDTKRLLQRGNTGNMGEQQGTDAETQISGRMSLEAPITASAGTIMGNLDAVFRLTHIGSQTLERFLYAMDPHENNEGIVRQRALLKKGTPRWIEVVIKNGSLSLKGEVAVGGTTIRLPAVNRLNMTSLPIQEQIQTLAGRLLPLLKGLKILSANTLLVKKNGAIDFLEEGK
ncbi:MAG: hypothetical protein LJE96_11965 [Deltaproteobacteria bacterium]|nr:hypothetical protein [Deltaproteobacteria bacterium]